MQLADHGLVSRHRRGAHVEFPADELVPVPVVRELEDLGNGVSSLHLRHGHNIGSA
jgi:hypothetical protein